MTQVLQSRAHTAGTSGRWRRVLSIVLAVASLPALAGCDVDSWMDPSVLGRWEVTPTTVPVLDRIAAVEPSDTGYAETSDVTVDDLVPVAAEYRITTGDALTVKIRDFLRLGEEAEFDRVVDKRGNIDLPRLAPVRVAGLTPVQARDAISLAIKNAGLLQDPTVSVVPQAQRQQTFSAFGSVLNPGTYFIPTPDYRLLQALTAAGGFQEVAPYVYVIRQVPLEFGLDGNAEVPLAPGQTPTPPPPEKLIDLIDELSKPQGGDKPSPAVYAGDRPAFVSARVNQQPPNGAAGREPPPIDLPDSPAPRPGAAPSVPPTGSGYQWQFLNGQWVKVAPQTPTAPAGSDGSAGVLPPLVTQRVIKIPMGPMISGVSKYNIVIRPGDIIHVPLNSDLLFYIGGQISRPGVYNIPRNGRITITNAVVAAGGLGSLAIPERVDLIRMIGPDRQATIRLNLRAIQEGTQPNIFLKNDDSINIGTNFFAYPLAVIRNGFRMTYGFGFLLDRNFGNDVFGPPPESFRF
ncbi:MAG: polysaccharide biosynthesis/export family protein [Phycisphaeraceae bacterium]|nr:polysaccharide biosynthesis/export family protein [Phycisphaeraceae bacterium]